MYVWRVFVEKKNMPHYNRLNGAHPFYLSGINKYANIFRFHQLNFLSYFFIKSILRVSALEASNFPEFLSILEYA